MDPVTSEHSSHELQEDSESQWFPARAAYAARTISGRQRVLQPEDVIAGNYDRIERKFIGDKHAACRPDATPPSATMHLDARRAL